MGKMTNIFKVKWVAAAMITLNMIGCTDVEEKDLNNKKTSETLPPIKKEEKKNLRPKEDEYTEAKVDLGLNKEDVNYLMLYEKLPMDVNSHKIHEKIPDLKGVRPEGGSDELAAQGLTESKMRINFLEKPAELEFNFKNDSLYSLYYTITEPDYNKAERLYKGIQQFYNKKIGQGIQQTAEEETRDLKTTIWSNTYPYCILTYNTNTGVIYWGFQKNKP